MVGRLHAPRHHGAQIVHRRSQEPTDDDGAGERGGGVEPTERVEGGGDEFLGRFRPGEIAHPGHGHDGGTERLEVGHQPVRGVTDDEVVGGCEETGQRGPDVVGGVGENGDGTVGAHQVVRTTVAVPGVVF